ncbi:MAG TPA: flavodoxin family protein, partial [Firmicutes bacterium]|nr:flavodoxin family protein [Bacillota bacterium]
MKKKLLAFSSSPRLNGNSETLLKEFCRAAENTGWEVELIRINNLDFKPCQACDLCARDGQCILKDDMQEIYPKLAASDALVIATPVTFGSVNAQLKMFIDRFQCWWNAKYTLKKPFIPEDAKHPGFFICVGALKKKDYCENAEQIIKVFFHNINHTLTGSMAFRGYDEKGAVVEDPEALEKVY